MSKSVIPAEPSTSPTDYEVQHVHSVYDNIASHFSSTRYKPWPVVAAFLSSIPAGWVGLDSGTGNGKYLPLPSDRPGETWTLGLDRSIKLLKIAKFAGEKERECIHGDALGRCWRAGAFDYVISIATIHHLSTPERRKEAIKCLLHCLSTKHGRGLIYVWAIQQDALSKRALPRNTSELRQGQDVFVPWVLPDNQKQKEQITPKETTPEIPNTTAVHQRYYHMFDEGELRALVCSAAEELGIESCSKPQTPYNIDTSHKRTFIDIVKDDWERSNYYVEFQLWKG